MKIEQKPKFQPITITLETRDEALLFWDFTNLSENKPTKRLEKLARQLSNWFSNNADI